MRFLKVGLAGIAIAGVLAGVVLVQPASGRENAGPYSVRYLVFTATPLPRTGLKPTYVPPTFDNLNAGSKLALRANPNEFMSDLARTEPRYRYRLVLSGQAVSDASGEVSISAGPAPGDPDAIIIKDALSIVSLPNGWAQVCQAGHITRRSSDGKGQSEAGWNGTRTRAIFGLTYANGIQIESSVRQIFFAFSVIKNGA